MATGTLNQAVTAAGMSPLVGGQNVDMNSLLGNIKDAVTGNYYSTIKLAPGTALADFYNFFNAGLGQADTYPLGTVVGPPPILTKVETNVFVASGFGLTPPYDIVIDSIGLYVHPMTIKADMDILTLYSYFEFSILSKVQWDGKIESYPAGMGYSGFSTQTDESGWQLGEPNPNAKKRFGHYGKYLSPNLQFMFTVFFPPSSGPVIAPAVRPGQASLTADNATPTPGVGTWLRGHMFGILGRPVT